VKAQKTSRIYFRVSSDKKAEIKKVAGKAGLSVTDLILARLENLPIKDYQKENQLLSKLNELTQELGFIGNNINQVTVAIHQIKNSQRMENGEFQEFNKLMEQYLTKRNELSESLQKIFFS
jgi:hypothetical protein